MSNQTSPREPSSTSGGLAPVDTSNPAKTAVRKEIYAARRARYAPDSESPADRQALARSIAEHGLALAREKAPSGGRVVSFVSMRSEPPANALNEALVGAGYELITPVTLDDRDLDWVPYGADLPAAVERTQLTEQQKATLLGPDAVADAGLLFVPGVAVDPQGTRLGRGGGSYDRALARVTEGTPIVVILHEDEVVPGPLPADPHDVPVTGVLTPSGHQPLGG